MFNSIEPKVIAAVLILGAGVAVVGWFIRWIITVEQEEMSVSYDPFNNNKETE